MMKGTPPHLQALEEIERNGIHGLVEVLREEGHDAVRYVLWDATGWHRDYSPPEWRNWATDEQKRKGWEMAVRIEKIIVTVLHEAHGRQVEEPMEALGEGPEGFTRVAWTESRGPLGLRLFAHGVTPCTWDILRGVPAFFGICEYSHLVPIVF